MLNEPKINFMTFEVRGILVEAYFQELKRYTIGEIREKLRPTAVESKPTEEELMKKTWISCSSRTLQPRPPETVWVLQYRGA